MRRKPDWSGPPGKWTAAVAGEIARRGQGKEGVDRDDDPAGLEVFPCGRSWHLVKQVCLGGMVASELGAV